ncbi:thioesterase domain-containing protein [Xanthobacter sp. ZOL 2024]
MLSRLRFAVALFAALFLTIAVRPAAAQGTPHVYLMRGLANVFSYGLDDLAAKLNARGIPATVYEYGQWQSLADMASAESRAHGRFPIVVVGHSLGADAAIQMAERLTALGTPPTLVVTFDPVGVNTVGAASGRFVNYYQSNNGYGKRLTAGPGFRGKLINRNLDQVAAIDHFNIEKSPQLHSEVVSQVRALGVRRKPKPRPVAKPAQPAAPTPAPGSQAATTSDKKAM